MSLPEDLSKPFNFRLLSLSHRQMVSFQKGLRGHTGLPSGGHRLRIFFRKRLHLPPNIVTSGKSSQSSKSRMFCAAKTGTFIFILVSHASFQGQDVVSGLKPRQNYIDWQGRQEGWKVRKTDIRSHPPTKETHHSMVPNMWFQLVSIGFN